MSKFILTAIRVDFTPTGYSCSSGDCIAPLLRVEFEAKNVADIKAQIPHLLRDLATAGTHSFRASVTQPRGSRERKPNGFDAMRDIEHNHTHKNNYLDGFFGASRQVAA